MSMELLRLSECCLFISDGDHQPPPKAEEGVPFITISNINGYNEIDFSECMHVPNDYYSKLSKNRKAQPGDILYSVVGSFGIPILIKDEHPFVFQRHIAILRPDARKVMPEYLYFLMKNPIFYKMADAYAVGTAQRTIGLTSLRKLKVMLPPIEIQKKVVDKLLPYDLLIQNNNKQIKLLEKIAEQLYKEWFVRFRFLGHENAEFENGIPKGWLKQRLYQFGITLDSGSRPSGGIDESLEIGAPSLGAEAISDLGEFDFSKVKLIPFEYYNKMKRGKNGEKDILIYKDGAYIGKTTIFMNGFPFSSYAVNEHVFLLNSTDTVYQYYLYFTLHQKEYFELMQNLNRNAAQPGLSQSDINRIKIVVPDKKVVIEFNKLIQPIFDLIFENAKQKQYLIKQRDLLLPRLMSGKLEV